jgi:anti-sigma-K factor RskA
MIDYQSYISSGILERYAAGMATAEEQQEVQELAAKHAEIRDELASIQRALEAFAAAHQVKPPSDLKHKIMQALTETPRQGTKSRAVPQQRAAEAVRQRPEKNTASPNISSLLTALLALVLLCACVAIYLFMSQANKAKNELAALQVQYDSLSTAAVAEKASFDKALQAYESLRHKGNRPLVMVGTDPNLAAAAMIHWNGQTKAAFLDVKELPPPPAGKAYQLWASVDGKGQFLKTIDTAQAGNGLEPLPFVENPQSFYATLEDKGQTTEPSLKNVVLFGRMDKN